MVTRSSSTRTALRAAVNEEARAAAFDGFLKEMEKEIPGGISTLANPASALKIDVIPTGAISVDVALGCGGIPRGRITEMFGVEGGGKSTLALSTAARCTQEGGRVGWVDAENALNPEYVKAIGVIPERFVPYQPMSGEDAIDMVEKMVGSGGFDMVVVDSVAALVPEAELDGDLNSQQPGQHARLMSRFMRRSVGMVGATNTALVLINQVRTNLGQYGAPEVSTGGKAIKFYSSVRLDVRSSPSKKIERGGKAVGQQVKVTVRKNRCGAPFREAEFDLYFGVGVDASGSVLDAAEAAGVLEHPKGSQVYTEVATGERLTGGKERVKERIAEDEVLRERLIGATYDAIRTSTSPTIGGIGEEGEELPADVAAALDDDPFDAGVLAPA